MRMPILSVFFLMLGTAAVTAAPENSMLAADVTGNLYCSETPYSAEVEYLETDGRQYIDTGLTIGSDTTFCCRYALDGYSPRYFPVFGIYEPDQYLGFQRSSGDESYAIHCWFGSSYKHKVVSPIPTDTVEFDGTTMRIGNVGYTFSSVAWFRSTSTAWFGRVNGLPGYAGGRLYSLTIWDCGELVLDLIPVRIGHVGCFYDRVTGMLFFNQGPGEFAVGPDLN